MKPLDSRSGAEGRSVIFLMCKEKQKGNTGLHRENAQAQRECSGTERMLRHRENARECSCSL